MGGRARLGGLLAVLIVGALALPAPHREALPPAMAMTAFTLPAHPMPRHVVDPTPTPAPPPTPAPARAVKRLAAPAATAPAQAAPPPAPVASGSAQQALINADRDAAGLAPLAWNDCLAAVATQNAARMAAQGYISHAGGAQQDLACRLGSRTGENIGYTSGGPHDAAMNSWFLNDPPHRANILGPFHYVGTAWVIAGNAAGYLAIEFG